MAPDQSVARNRPATPIAASAAGCLAANRALVGLIAVWLAVVVAGVWALSRYAGGAGEPGIAPPLWPAASALPHDGQRPTLLMFVHPQCSCSRASLEGLARLMAEVDGAQAARTVVLVAAPAAMATDWPRGVLWDQAAAIPGVEVVADRDGREAAVFGAATSGQTLLYGGDGRLQFSGGITPARGHAGDSAGHTALRSLLRHQTAHDTGAAVFGCALHDRPSGAAAGVAP